jgi:hypothetical protein
MINYLATIHFRKILGSCDPDSIPNRVRFLSAEAKRIGIARTRFCQNRPSTTAAPTKYALKGLPVKEVLEQLYTP